MKNVTGYDLNRVYAGSLGTLAVITEGHFQAGAGAGGLGDGYGDLADADAAVAASQELQRQHYAPLACTS